MILQSFQILAKKVSQMKNLGVRDVKIIPNLLSPRLDCSSAARSVLGLLAALGLSHVATVPLEASYPFRELP